MHVSLLHLLLFATCRAKRHQRAQQQYEQKLHAVKEALSAWMHRAGESRAIQHLTSQRSRVDGAPADGAVISGLGASGVPTANGPQISLSGGPNLKKMRSALAAAPAAGAGVADASVELGDEVRLLVNNVVGEQEEGQPAGQGGGPAGPAAAVAGEGSSGITSPRDKPALQSFPLRGVTGGERTGMSGVGVSRDGSGGLGEVKAALANDMEHGALHTAESMKIIDAGVEAVAAVMPASGGDEGHPGRKGSECQHHVHLGVGAARLIPRADSWSTVSTVAGDDSAVDGGLDQQEADVGRAGRREGVRGSTAGAAMAAVSDADDDTPTRLKAMEAGRSRYAFQQQQQQQQQRGDSQQGSMLSHSAGQRGGEKDPLQGVDGMSYESGSPSSLVMSHTSVEGRNQGVGKDTIDDGSPRLDGVDPSSWWGSR